MNKRPRVGAAPNAAIFIFHGCAALRAAQASLPNSNLPAKDSTMARGAAQLSLTAVPSSGAEEWAGLAGEMAINIVEGKHFEFTLVKTP